MRIYFKFSQWEKIDIPEELEELFKGWLEVNPDPSPSDVTDWLKTLDKNPDREDCCDTYECMSLDDNSGSATTELQTDDGKTIWDNVKQFAQE